MKVRLRRTVAEVLFVHHVERCKRYRAAECVVKEMDQDLAGVFRFHGAGRMNHDLAINGLTVKKCRHGYFLLNQHDLFISRALDLYGEWCEAEIETLKPYIPDGAVVLDVGANIGTHAVAFAKLAGQNGHVLAFEPQRFIYYMLCANAALNCLTNLQCFKLGVSDAPGKARIAFKRPDTDFNFGGIALTENDKVGPSEPVDCITVDSLKLTRCDVIKVDVEGHEERVIRGAKETLKRCKPVLFVENNRPEFSKGIYEALQQSGYAAYWHLAPYYSERNHFGNKDNVFKNYVPEANVLCLPSDERKIPMLRPVKGPEETWESAWAAMRTAV